MLKYKRNTCLSFLLLSQTVAFSQQELLVYVTTNDGKPLQYASVIWGKNEGLVSDTSGFLQVPDKNKIDSLIITAIGFERKVLSKESVINKSKIEISLETINIELQEIVVAKYIVNKQYGASNKKETSYFKHGTCVNLQSALLVKSYNHPAQCKSISVFISRESTNEVPYRLRLYEIGPDKLPGKDLITNKIIVALYKKNAWNIYTFDSSKIQLPNNGFFVAVEWLCNDVKVENGLCLGLTNKIDEALSYYKYGNMGWFQLKFKNTLSKDNIMIKSEIVSVE